MAQDSGAGGYRRPRNNIIHPLRHALQYFYGLNNSIVHGNVRAILDSVVAALSLNPSRKFTCVLAVSLLSLFNILSMYVEQSYFARWWRLQPQHTRTLVRALVESGQLSFANGGWCMHDEATPHYVDMIDQMTLGSALFQALSFLPPPSLLTQAHILASAAGLRAHCWLANRRVRTHSNQCRCSRRHGL